MKTKAPVLFDEAVRKLQEANEELCRPEEDVVSYLVCKNSQVAIENFLKGYLLKNGIIPVGSETINELYQQCLSRNEKFGDIDLTNFSCKNQQCESRSCSDNEKVSNCYKIAEKMDLFLRQEKVFV